MPQMAPLNWLTLMFFFILIFLLFNSLNYYNFLYNIPNNKNTQKLNFQINWKW